MEPQISKMPQTEQVNTEEKQIQQPQPEEQKCKYCNNLIALDVFYCPICGKKLKELPLSTSLKKQIGIYAISLFLPPLGLMPGVKYLLSKEKHARLIGAIAILLTILSLIVTVLYTINLSNQITNQINRDLQPYGL